MRSSLSRWRRRLLLLACGSYWTILALVLLGPPILAGWRVTRPEAGHGTITGSLDGTQLSFTMTGTHTTPWHGSIGLGALALWIFLPPLVLWLALRSTQPEGHRAGFDPHVRAGDHYADAGMSALRQPDIDPLAVHDARSKDSEHARSARD